MMIVKLSRKESITTTGTRFSVEPNLMYHSFPSMNGVCYTTSSMNWAGGNLIVDDRCCEKSEYITLI